MNHVRNSARRPTLQLQLTLLYAGLFAGLCLAVLAATNLIVVRGRTPAGADVHRLNIASAAVSFPVAVTASLVLGWAIAGRLLRPLRAVIATARDISATDLQRRLDLGGPQNEGIDVDAPLSPAPVVGDPGLVAGLVANLVDNALRHNVPGGDVAISTTSAAGHASISVSNTGPLLPPDEVERLFQPFQRSGVERVRHRDGHGLGLAIVQAIAGAHRATVSARPRPSGGLDIEVRFPNNIS
jgi:signal transduction histidine kinase